MSGDGDGGTALGDQIEGVKAQWVVVVESEGESRRFRVRVGSRLRAGGAIVESEGKTPVRRSPVRIGFDLHDD